MSKTYGIEREPAPGMTEWLRGHNGKVNFKSRGDAKKFKEAFDIDGRVKPIPYHGYRPEQDPAKVGGA